MPPRPTLNGDQDIMSKKKMYMIVPVAYPLSATLTFIKVKPAGPIPGLQNIVVPSADTFNVVHEISPIVITLFSAVVSNPVPVNFSK